MSNCIECGGETRLTWNPNSRFRSILIVDAATGKRHVCDVCQYCNDGADWRTCKHL